MKQLILISSILCIGLQGLALNFNEAIQKLKDNKYAEARSSFQELQKTDSNKAKASLALALMDMHGGNYTDAFGEFKQFYYSHPEPNPYLYALINTNIFRSEETKDNRDVLQFFRRVLDDPKTDVALGTCIIDLLGFASEREDELDAARRRFSLLHDIANWSTLGSFENVSGSGFNKDYGALRHPEPEHEFVNKLGQPVKWFDIAAVRTDRWWDMTYYHYTHDAVIYSQTFLESEEDKDAILMAGVSGSMKVWVNDYLVVNEEEERNTNADVYQAWIKLQKGTNRILVQTGSSDIDRNNFMIRLADKDGNLMENVTSSTHYKPYTQAKPYTIEKIAFYPEHYFEKVLTADSTDWLAKMMLLLVYANNQNNYPAHKMLAELQRTAPVSTILATEAIGIANSDKNLVEANKQRERIKTNDPDSYEGLLIKLSSAISTESWDEAIDILKNKQLPSRETTEALIGLYAKRNEQEKMNAELQNAYEKYPEDERIVLYKYYSVLNGTKDTRKANDILLQYLKNRHSEKVMDLVIEGDLKIGNKIEAEQLIRKEISIRPYDASLYLKLAKYFYDLKNYNKAIESMNFCFTLCPYVGKYYYNAGSIYEAMGNKEFACKMYKLCIQYSPANMEAREKLRSLESRKKMKDYFKQNDVVQIYHAALKNETYKKEDAVVLVNDHRQIVYPEQGAGEEQVERLVLVNSQTAISNFKEFHVSYNSYTQKLIIDKAEILKPDGNKVPAERQKGYCVFSSLAVGDAIHVYYRLENSYEGKLAEHFWNEMYFNNVYPTELSRFSLIVPEGKKFQTFISDSNSIHSDTIVDGYRMLSWEQNNLPKIELEISMNYAAFHKIAVTSIPDWNYIANWYTDISNHKTIAKYEVKEVVKQLMSGQERATDLEKAQIIYEYIEKNYNYSSVSFLQSAFTPQSATRTYTTKLGDCKDLSTLFVSMTREAGLNSNLVLVRTNGAGSDDIELPSIAFNHCIAQLHCGEKDYLIEMTSNVLPFSAIAYSLYQANGLCIPYQSDATVSAGIVKLYTPNKPINANVRNTSIKIDGDNAVVHRVVKKIGVEAAGLRISYGDADNEQRLKTLTAIVHKEFNKDIRIENLNITHLKDLSDTLNLEYDVQVGHFSSELMGMKVFRLPWTDANLVETLFSLSDRKYMLDLKAMSYINCMTENIEVKLPQGKKLAELPKDVHIVSPVLDYTLTFKMTGDKLVAQRGFKVLKDFVLPSEYTGVRDMVNKISQADQTDLAVK